jgi:putative tryptophan/tyrosine transport system substrate-binding protein
MRRRDFLKVITASACIWPALASAQQSTKVARIGWMSVGSPTASDTNMSAFRRGMRELGYIEEKTFTMEPRFADGKDAVLPEQAVELERMGVDCHRRGPLCCIAGHKAEHYACPDYYDT